MLMIGIDDIEKIEDDIWEMVPAADGLDLQIIEKVLKKLRYFKPDNLSKDIISKIKNDDQFFKELVNFLERNRDKRNLILDITKRNLLDGCKGIRF